jgi:mannose-1-phosphate guanylyltransferase/phosphomannomutase
MKAIILAGGLGTRLFPLTATCPKPMMLLNDEPVLTHVLRLLKYHGFAEVIMTVQYLANQIQDYFGDGSDLGMNIQYIIEESPLGTAGSVKNAQPHLDQESFLVISGDLITNINLTSVLRFHCAKRALATMALTRIANPRGYGVVVTDGTGRIQQFIEKPNHGAFISKAVNTGIYILEPTVLDCITAGTYCDFSYYLFPWLLHHNRSFFGCMVNGYWRDIGTIKNYHQAKKDMLAGKVDVLNQDIGRNS